MAVRNFWIEADIDGRQTIMEGGPRRADGGFKLTIYQRENGGITTAAHIEGKVGYDDQLILMYDIGEKHGNHITRR